jgi:hypothetical protein
MTSKRRPWTRAKTQRVSESVFCGGYSAQRTASGWVVAVTGSDSRRFWATYLVPLRTFRGRSKWWLSRRLTNGLRASITGHEGARRISGEEAWRLVRWCFRWGRPRPLMKEERTRAEGMKRPLKPRRVPDTIHNLSYLAERSRRGWVIRLRANSRRLTNPYVIPFRSAPRRRIWSGRGLLSALQQSVSSLDGARRIDCATEQRLLAQG